MKTIRIESYSERLCCIVEESLAFLQKKVNQNRFSLSNEASFQLQFGSILKSIGELYSYSPDDRFFIEIEKTVFLNEGSFIKSKSNKANIDIVIGFETKTPSDKVSCAIELKFFKQGSGAPRNRYNFFVDLHNLEQYMTQDFESEDFSVDFGFMIVGTDHGHYVDQSSDYGEAAEDFDFRDGKKYIKNTNLIYKEFDEKAAPSKSKVMISISLKNNYEFKWHKSDKSFLILKIS